jgi:hypothetical protein
VFLEDFLFDVFGEFVEFVDAVLFGDDSSFGFRMFEVSVGEFLIASVGFDVGGFHRGFLIGGCRVLFLG